MVAVGGESAANGSQQIAPPRNETLLVGVKILADTVEMDFFWIKGTAG